MTKFNFLIFGALAYSQWCIGLYLLNAVWGNIIFGKLLQIILMLFIFFGIFCKFLFSKFDVIVLKKITLLEICTLIKNETLLIEWHQKTFYYFNRRIPVCLDYSLNRRLKYIIIKNINELNISFRTKHFFFTNF